jgi:hypothetical protein
MNLTYLCKVIFFVDFSFGLTSLYIELFYSLLLTIVSMS